MSQDQKPRPIKAVKITGDLDAHVPSDPEESTDVAYVIAEQEAPEASPKSGASYIPAILFLLACALGGVGFSALPHLMPEMAKQLDGEHP